MNKKGVKEKRSYLFTCTECGKKDSTVHRRACVYSADVHNEVVMEIVCDACEHEHALDI